MNEYTPLAFERIQALRRQCNEEVKAALKAGEIKKPVMCTNCGRVFKDLVPHHEDYTEPLQISWICKICHRTRHSWLRISLQMPPETEE